MRLRLAMVMACAGCASALAFSSHSFAPGGIHSFHAKQHVVYSSVRPRARHHASMSSDKQTLGGASILRTLTSANFSLLSGSLGVAFVLANRLLGPAEVSTMQSRSDLIGAVACFIVLAHGVTILDLTAVEGEEVTLVGTLQQVIAEDLPPAAQGDLRWLCQSLITCVGAVSSVVVQMKGKTVAKYGVMGEASQVDPEAPILAKCLREGVDGKEIYLPALQNLPGRVEFEYLPPNCQGVVLQPILNGQGAVIIGQAWTLPLIRQLLHVPLIFSTLPGLPAHPGTNRAKALSPRDLVWVKAACQQATTTLEG
ncbi:unnamed protein product [Chrysoparadoxa australica]